MSDEEFARMLQSQEDQFASEKAVRDLETKLVKRGLDLAEKSPLSSIITSVDDVKQVCCCAVVALAVTLFFVVYFFVYCWFAH